ncbi:hypothetical protein QYM36_019544 [Artemia franciscana]|uniref:HTH psq-type domain-containing protein n=1 Tax=Artemia franciscana TaxID=6661 RepID=A0AA88H135_ARTSF|nr:hypothetical protein QYM36_019544 [Artemia franciscana]
MVRNRVPKRPKGVSDEAMNIAVSKVLMDKASIRSTATAFGIPKSTLIDNVRRAKELREQEQGGIPVPIQAEVSNSGTSSGGTFNSAFLPTRKERLGSRSPILPSLYLLVQASTSQCIYPNALTMNNIISGFSKPGIWPFNRNAFSDEDFYAASVRDRPKAEPFPSATERNPPVSDLLDPCPSPSTAPATPAAEIRYSNALTPEDV